MTLVKFKGRATLLPSKMVLSLWLVLVLGTHAAVNPPPDDPTPPVPPPPPPFTPPSMSKSMDDEDEDDDDGVEGPKGDLGDTRPVGGDDDCPDSDDPPPSRSYVFPPMKACVSTVGAGCEGSQGGGYKSPLSLPQLLVLVVLIISIVLV